MPRFIWALAFIIVLSYFMSLANRRRRRAVWSGVATEIRHQRASITRDEERRDDDWVTIFYRTDEGKHGKFKLRLAGMRQLFPDLRPGDRLVKTEGSYLPRRCEPAVSESSPGPSPLT